MKKILFVIIIFQTFLTSCKREMDNDLIGKWDVKTIYFSDTASIKSPQPNCFLLNNQEYIGQFEFEKNQNVQVYNKENHIIGLGYIHNFDENTLSISGFCFDQKTNYEIYKESKDQISLTAYISGETLHLVLTRK